MQKKWCKKITALLTAALLTASPLMGALAKEADEYTDAEKELYGYYINEVVRTLGEEYKFNYPTVEVYQKIVARLIRENPSLLEELIQIAADSVDEHTMYFKRDELKDFMETTAGSYVGIGVTVTRESGYVMIKAVTPNSPALRAGLQAGDKISTIEGQDATGYDVATAREHIRGEAGTSVKIGILRGEEYMEFDVMREEVDASPVEYEITQNGIGYLYISQFNDLAIKDVAAALADFDQQGITDLVIDLRDNPGGYLQSVVSILENFVPNNMTLVKVDFKNDAKDQTITSKASFREPKYNLVVLTNGNTASAAEVFTGCIMDNKLGAVVGETTYGKATIQEFMGLVSFSDMNLGDIKLTVGEYLTPGDRNIHHKGIAPHIKIHNPSEPIDTTGFAPFLFTAKYQRGDTGEGVLAIKQRLNALGYPVGEVDDQYDSELEVAVSTFQRNVGLYPYGVMDITTQTFLNNGINSYRKTVDEQYNTAMELVKDHTRLNAVIQSEPRIPSDELQKRSEADNSKKG